MLEMMIQDHDPKKINMMKIEIIEHKSIFDKSHSILEAKSKLHVITCTTTTTSSLFTLNSITVPSCLLNH